MDRLPPVRAVTRTLAPHHDARDRRAVVAAIGRDRATSGGDPVQGTARTGP